MSFVKVLTYVLVWISFCDSFGSNYGTAISSNIFDSKSTKRGPYDGSGYVVRQKSDELILKRLDKEECLSISLNENGSVVLSFAYEKKFIKNHEESKAEGVFGIFRLETGTFVAVITKSKDAHFIGPGVREICDVDLIPIPSRQFQSRLHKLNDENSEIKLLKKAFTRHTFYYSKNQKDYDITRNTQSNYLKKELISKSQIYDTCDNRFYWNFNLLKPFRDSNFEDWVSPVINAWAANRAININGVNCSLTLISRRSRTMQGTRYIKRGIDESGGVANFVETEQILRYSAATDSSSSGDRECESDQRQCVTAAFTQVRGSVPLFWSQPITWHLKPDIVIDSARDDPPTPIPSLAQTKTTSSHTQHESTVPDGLGLNTTTKLDIQRDGLNAVKNQEISARVSHSVAMWKHLRDLFLSYIRPLPHSTPPISDEKQPGFGGRRRMVIVNLIDKHKAQGKLGQQFARTLRYLASSNDRIGVVSQDQDKKIGLFDRKTITVEDHKIVMKPDLEHQLQVQVDDEVNDLEVGDSLLFDHEANLDINTGEGPVPSGFALSGSCGGSVETNPLGSGECEGEAIDDSMDVRYVWFDFHKQCKGGKPDHLVDIFPSLRDSLTGPGSYFCMRTTTTTTAPVLAPAASEGGTRTEIQPSQGLFEGAKVTSLQESIIRTNCIDCLDRTNVIQTTIARWSLLHQLRQLGIIPSHETNSNEGSALSETSLSLPDKEQEKVLRKLWGDNGDHMSELYAGTRALKRDVTRHGRRTNKGKFDDGVNSMMRYYINNFKDPKRQRGLDLMLGITQEAESNNETQLRLQTVSTQPFLTDYPDNKYRFKSKDIKEISEHSTGFALSVEGIVVGDGYGTSDVIRLTTGSTPNVELLEGLYNSIEKSFQKNTKDIEAVLAELKKAIGDDDDDDTSGGGDGGLNTSPINQSHKYGVRNLVRSVQNRLQSFNGKSNIDAKDKSNSEGNSGTVNVFSFIAGERKESRHSQEDEPANESLLEVVHEEEDGLQRGEKELVKKSSSRTCKEVVIKTFEAFKLLQDSTIIYLYYSSCDFSS